jgi:hypothetical protein
MSNAGDGKRRSARCVPLPFRTFAELLAKGLEVHVYCAGCRGFRRAEIKPEHLDRCFAGARFRCPCGAPGHPSFRPPGELITPGSAIEHVDLYCGRCVPPWEIRDVRLEMPPWSTAPLGRGERYRCPSRGRLVAMLAQGQPGIPFTERYRESRRD